MKRIAVLVAAVAVVGFASSAFAGGHGGPRGYSVPGPKYGPGLHGGYYGPGAQIAPGGCVKPPVTCHRPRPYHPPVCAPRPVPHYKPYPPRHYPVNTCGRAHCACRYGGPCGHSGGRVSFGGSGWGVSFGW